MNTEEQLPEPFSERFHIFAVGKDFDVDAFLARSMLDPDYIWRPHGGRHSSGLEVLLGRQRLPVIQQEEIAINYLKAKRDELRSLARFPGVEAVNLGLPYYIPLHASGYCLGPPAELTYRALEAEVTPLYYCTLQSGQSKSLLDRGVRRFPKGQVNPFARMAGTPLWRAVDEAISALVRDRDLVEVTHHERIVSRVWTAINRRHKVIAARFTGRKANQESKN